MSHQRIYYPPGNGIIDCNLQWPAAHSDSTVVATISEAHAAGVLAGQRDARRFLGDANMSVLNVVPHDGGVTVRVHIDWSEPLHFAVDFTILS